MVTRRPTRKLAHSTEIGPLVSEGRRRAGLSQAEFASRLGVSRKTISDLERGAAENLSFNTAMAALWLAGFQLEANPRRPPTLNEVMARRAVDIARAEQAEGISAPTENSRKR
jgi:transcriptional regulator with XRE-family HTH domain